MNLKWMMIQDGYSVILLWAKLKYCTPNANIFVEHIDTANIHTWCHHQFADTTRIEKSYVTCRASKLNWMQFKKELNFCIPEWSNTPYLECLPSMF
jgi:hypothetical protein